MKAIITGDWHIRVKPGIPEKWQMDRYRDLINRVIDLCHANEACLFLTGDIADKNRPSLLEMQLLIELFTRVADEGIDCWLISGNHEAIGQGESTFDYLTPLFQTINQQDGGQIHYSTDNLMLQLFAYDKLWVTFAGHPALSRALDYHSPHFGDGFTNILVSHFRPTINQFIQEEVEVERLIAPYHYTFASDIHLPLTLYDGRLIYTNHPLNSSFEMEPDCGCLLLECTVDKLCWQRLPLHLPNLVQLTSTARDFQEPGGSYDYYRVEILGTPEELRRIGCTSENVKLLKVPEVLDSYADQEEAGEIRDTTLEEGLLNYMGEMGMTDRKIEEMMGVYREQ